MNEDRQRAYQDGRRSQNEIIASKPDVGVDQWIARSGALRGEMLAAVCEVERIRGRLDAIGLHIGRARGAS